MEFVYPIAYKGKFNFDPENPEIRTQQPYSLYACSTPRKWPQVLYGTPWPSGLKNIVLCTMPSWLGECNPNIPAMFQYLFYKCVVQHILRPLKVNIITRESWFWMTDRVSNVQHYMAVPYTVRANLTVSSHYPVKKTCFITSINNMRDKRCDDLWWLIVSNPQMQNRTFQYYMQVLHTVKANLNVSTHHPMKQLVSLPVSIPRGTKVLQKLYFLPWAFPPFIANVFGSV